MITFIESENCKMIGMSPDSWLHEQFKNREWFYSVERDQYNRLVVYTKFSCHETLHDIPDRVEGIQVLCHFAGSKTATAVKFASSTIVKVISSPKLELVLEEKDDKIEELDSSFLEFDLNELYKKLDCLERRCGSISLQDIFYEVHDGENSITNLSAKYPEVRRGLEELYDEYGFDVIYNELDG